MRVSYGSALRLGLLKGKSDLATTTLYTFLLRERCRGSCAFCPQPLGRSDRISRVEWPEFGISEVLGGIERATGIRRVCVQCADEPGISAEAAWLAEVISPRGVPISVSTPPLPKCEMVELRRAGVDVITIPIDCASRERFRSIKGRDHNEIMGALECALEVFGHGKVGTHIIVGLGESEREVVELIQRVFRMGVIPSLFAFTPIKGTPLGGLDRPTIESYRRVQVARHLIVEMGLRSADFEFGEGGRITGVRCDRGSLERAFSDGRAFMVRGCPDCNRPFFNEGPAGPFYNCPSEEEARKASREWWSG